MAQTKIKAGLFEGVIGNGTDGYFLMSNGDGTMTWSSIVINPTIASIAYPGSVTAADPAGGETITVTGTGFKTGATVTIGGTAAPAVSYVSATQITFTTPAKAAGDYDIVVTNTDTGSATFINGISYNGIPTWTTAAGSLGTFASDTTISTITLQATEPDAGTITFSITNGALPTGLSLTGANIDGTTTLETADTLYTFTVTATDDESQATPRTFTITVTKEFIGTENFTINTYTGNGTARSIEGKIGTAASFNGSSGQIDLNYASLGMGVNNFSYSFWFKTNNTTASQTFMQVLSEHINYGIRINSTAGHLGSYPTNSSGGGEYISAAVTIDTDWHHVAYIKSSTTGVGHALYYDGTKIAEDTSFTGNVQTATDNKITLGSATNDINWYNGSLDQVRFFNKALSSSEVTTLHGENNTSTTKSTTDIFDDGSGVALYEFEKGAIDTGGTNGYIGAAGVFNGSSSKIVVSGFAQPTSDLSASMWIKFNSIPSTQKEFLDWVGNSSVPTIRLNTYNSNDMRFSIGSSRYISADSLSITTGVWYHIAFSIDRSANVATFYFNGSALGGTVNSSGSSSDTEGLFIGCNLDENRFSDCIIDQVRIFSKAISSSEVTTLYGETSASATKSTTDIFDDSSGIALYELEGNANDTGDTYNGTATNVSYAYDGTPTNVSFVGTSFQPDLVWIKSRGSARNHMLSTSVQQQYNYLSTNLTNAEAASSARITSLDSNGFTIGTSANVNENNIDFTAWAWKGGGTAVSNTDGSITSSVSANQAAGFSIVKYTGNGSAGATVGHGLSSVPEMIIVKGLDNALNWIVYHTSIGSTKYIQLNTSGAAELQSNYNMFDSTAPSSTVFSLGNLANTNSNTLDYIAYCFHSVDGYQKVGSYTGNRPTDVVIDTGFAPRFVMIKCDASGESWTILDSSRGDNLLHPNTSGVEQSYTGVSLTSTGFTVHDSGLSNTNGAKHIYLAIA